MEVFLLKQLNNNKGVTLIEIVISIALIGIISMMAVTVLNYGLLSSSSHKQSLVANEIASNQLEWLRTLSYDTELGLVGGFTPAGIVNPNLYRNISGTDPYLLDGIEYKVRTRITWEDDITLNGRTVDDARKKVDVIVQASNPFTKEQKEFSFLGTMFTFEGQQNPTQPGIKVVVYKGSIADENRAPRVLIEKKGFGPTFSYTDHNGRAIFPNLPKGSSNTYQIAPIAWDFGEIMFRPIGVDNSTGLMNQKWLDYLQVKDVPNQVSFVVDYPAYLNFINSDKLPANSYINFNFGSTEIYPVQDITTPLQTVNNFKLWPNWIYNYKIETPLGEYYIATYEDGKWGEWNGYFDSNQNSATIKNVLLHFGLEFEANTTTIKDSYVKDISYDEIIDGQAVRINAAEIMLKFTAPLNPNQKKFGFIINDTEDFLNLRWEKLSDNVLWDEVEINNNILKFKIVDTNHSYSDFFTYISDTNNKIHLYIPTPVSYDEYLKNGENYLNSNYNVPLWGYSTIEKNKAYGVLNVE